MTNAQRFVLAGGLAFFSLSVLYGQQPAPAMPGQPLPSASAIPVAANGDSLTIAPGDILTVRVFDVPDLEQGHLRVTDSGQIPLLLLGQISVAGLTPAQASNVIAAAYMEKEYLRNAQVEVTVESYSSSSVTVYGYVNGGSAGPGALGALISVTSPKPLLTILSMAGGLSDRASHTITIQRRDMSSKPFSVFIPNDPTVDLANHVMIYPGDIIVVPRAGVVYILGDVNQAHGVVMSEDGRISLMQALSQAGSTIPSAKLSKVMIFRKKDGNYQSLVVNFGDMTKGKVPDIQLQAEDVVWVPFSFGKNLLVNGSGIASALTSAAVTGIIYTH